MELNPILSLILNLQTLIITLAPIVDRSPNMTLTRVFATTLPTHMLTFLLTTL